MSSHHRHVSKFPLILRVTTSFIAAARGEHAARSKLTVPHSQSEIDGSPAEIREVKSHSQGSALSTQKAETRLKTKLAPTVERTSAMPREPALENLTVSIDGLGQLPPAVENQRRLYSRSVRGSLRLLLSLG